MIKGRTRMLDLTLRLFRGLKRTMCTFTVVLYLLVFSTSGCLAQQVGNECNSTSYYFNNTLNVCVLCTDCAARGLETYTNCTPTSDVQCYLQCLNNHYYSSSTGQCERCSQCEKVESQCTPLSDTVCHQCGETESYNAISGVCVTNCSKCPHGCLPDKSVCTCAPTTEYFDESSQSCSLCTVCAKYERLLVECTATTDTKCGAICPKNQYYENNLCKTCSNCSTSSAVKKACSPSSNTQCCEAGLFYNLAVLECTPDCDQCPLRRCSDTHTRCLCSSDCQTGVLCNVLSPDCLSTSPATDPTSTGDRTIDSSAGTMNPITSALIAVGAVIGIIIFSALFVLLGVFTSCNRGGGNLQNDSSSNNSSDRFLGSASLASLYANGQSPLPYQEYRTSLDILRLSGSGGNLSDGFGSPKASPKSKKSNSNPLVTSACKYRDNNWTPV